MRTYTPPVTSITEAQIYPNGYKIPQGRRVKDFRPARNDEEWLGFDGAAYRGATIGPRLILEDVPAPKRYSIEVEEDEGGLPTGLKFGDIYGLPSGATVRVIAIKPLPESR